MISVTTILTCDQFSQSTLASALRRQFSYKTLCVDKMSSQCTGEKWSHAVQHRLLLALFDVTKIDLFLIFISTMEKNPTNC